MDIGVVGIEADRVGVGGKGAVPVPVVAEPDHGEGRPAVCAAAVESERAAGGRSRGIHDLAERHPRPHRAREQRPAQCRPPGGEPRVQTHRPLQQGDPLIDLLVRDQAQRLQEQIVRLRAPRGRRPEPGLRARRKLPLQARHHRVRHVHLHTQHLAPLAVEVPVPDVVAGPDVRQVHRDPRTVTLLPDRTFEEVCDAGGPGPLAPVRSGQLGRRTGRQHGQPRELPDR